MGKGILWAAIAVVLVSSFPLAGPNDVDAVWRLTGGLAEPALVASPGGATLVRTGEGLMALHVPTSEGTVVVDLKREETVTKGPFLELGIDRPSRTFHVAFDVYRPLLSALSDAVGTTGRLVVSEEGGIAGHVSTGGFYAAFSGVEGSVANRMMGSLPTQIPLRAVVEERTPSTDTRQEDLGTCDAGFGACTTLCYNTEDLNVCGVECGVTGTQCLVNVDYALQGEAKWCTRNAGNWPALLDDVADRIQGTFAENGATRAFLIGGGASCWVSSSYAAAQQCDASGGCTHGDGHTYTFNACNGGPECYRDRAWSDVAHNRQHSSAPPHLKVVQIIHDGLFDPPGPGLACGLASLPGTGQGPSGDSTAAGPFSQGGFCEDSLEVHDMTPAHEVGHTFGALHEWTMQESYGLSGCWDIMKTSGTDMCPFFGPRNMETIDDCVQLQASTCPRAGLG